MRRSHSTSFPSIISQVSRHSHRVHGKGALDAHNKWHVYNGNDAHRTLPFKGPGARYTFVFFSMRAHRKVPKDGIHFLRDVVNIKWPTRPVAPKEYPPGPARVAAAKAAYREWAVGAKPAQYSEVRGED